ncbi:hypothetical protein ALC57_13816 [Trachymyrmex cornetzi]|uniref:DUF5641 domain-containing protein n=1 Tax=Trachymyrmex cornetzi TaxID=471704 RepID=A0A151IZ00_9HYME|nr:hypothetical protein ALC57_13816 [Trachymyrmex cornetzi]
MSYVAAAKYMGKSKSFVAKWVQQCKKTKNVDDLPERGSMFMKEYIELKHMKRADYSQGDKIRNFLPHHAVTKNDRTTTKIRVVFDASSKNLRSISLNDVLYKGPTLQSDLFTIVVRFRCFKYVLCADIKMMYRQILIHPLFVCMATKIVWHFIPARWPHYGGLWEAAVRSMKRHLKRTIGDTCLTVSELTTVLTQVEVIMNSRPLTPLSEDPNDLRAITPGHFLIGENLQAYPERDVRDLAVNRLSRLQHIEQIKQHFWSRWQKEYLSTCQQRNKWKADSGIKPAVGHLVLQKDSEALPLKWALARIHPGEDGVVRTVTVRTEKGTYKRAVVNICPLLEN